MKNKVAMITGATGFLGQALCRFVPDGFDLCTPSRSDLENMSSIFYSADYVIHAAGYAAPKLFTQNPINTIEINTKITENLLRYVNPKGAFLFCSSSEVYKGLMHFASEDEIGTTTPYHPRSSYIEGKKCGEAIVYAHRCQGVRAISARIGLTYGPRTRPHDARVLNQLIEQALLNKKIELIDDGSATIPLCYVDDMAKMLWKILLDGTQPVYNVGNPQTISIADLTRKIGQKLNVPVHIPDYPTGAPHAKMDLMRFNTEFGPPDYTSWEEGLDATIAYQKELYGIV